MKVPTIGLLRSLPCDRYLGLIGSAERCDVRRAIRHSWWRPVSSRVPVADGWVEIPSRAAGEKIRKREQASEKQSETEFHLSLLERGPLESKANSIFNWCLRTLLFPAQTDVLALQPKRGLKP